MAEKAIVDLSGFPVAMTFILGKFLANVHKLVTNFSINIEFLGLV